MDIVYSSAMMRKLLTYELLVVKGGEAESGGRLAGGDRPVGVLQPLLQQRLQLAHVLEGEVQGLESEDGIVITWANCTI
jgi:hypothetical protein